MAGGSCSKGKGVYVDLTNDEDIDINGGSYTTTDEEIENSFGGFQCSVGGAEHNIGATSNTNNTEDSFGGFQCSVGGAEHNIGATSNTNNTEDSFGGFHYSVGGAEHNIGATSNTNNTEDSFGGFQWSLGGVESDFCATDGTNKAMSNLTEADVFALKFNSEAEAEIWYNLYGKVKGFSIRKDNRTVNNEGIVLSRRWYCSKAGFRQQHHLQRQDRLREPRALTRVGCTATLRIRLMKNGSEYEVVDFVKKHNHPLAAPPCVPFLWSHRKVNSPDKAQVSSMRAVGIKPSKIMDLMVCQSGGYENVGFTQKDLYNHVNVARREEVSDGDADAALCLLRAFKDKDPSFFYKYDVDDEGCLSKLFWSDGRSQLDYARFGDGLVFDTTYKTNAYRKPFVILVGVNNHWQSTIFGCALLADEKVDTYLWVLETFIQVMKGKRPMSVVTDGDKAMRRAIQQILPLSHHRLCQWHIQRNAVTNIRIQGFASRFNHCMTNRCSPEDFETAWLALLDDFQLHNNRWMMDMYEARSIWAEAFLKEHFFADMTTTQRCEGINSFVKYFVKSKMRLYEFVRIYEKALDRLRNNEAKAHNDTDQTKPVLTTTLHHLERHATDIYTRAMFFKVRDEILEQAKFFVVERILGLGYINFYLSEYARPIVRFNVLYYPEESKFECSCLLFDGMGIPCRHMIAVMKVEHVLEIPKSCILQRWLKTDNSSIESSCLRLPDAETQTTRLAVLKSSCNEMSYFASLTNEGWTELRGRITQWTVLMKDFWNNRNKGKSCKRPHGVRDPKVVETKGTKPAKNSKQSTRKCSNCSSFGHTRPRCPKLQPRSSTMDHEQPRSSTLDHDQPTQRNSTNASISTQTFTHLDSSIGIHPPDEFQFDLNCTDDQFMQQINETDSNFPEISRETTWDIDYNHNIHWDNY